MSETTKGTSTKAALPVKGKSSLEHLDLVPVTLRSAPAVAVGSAVLLSPHTPIRIIQPVVKSLLKIAWQAQVSPNTETNQWANSEKCIWR